MENNIESKIEQALLISVDTGDFDAEASINELAELAKTAGAEVQGMMLQRRDTPVGATYVGAGRLAEIAQFCRNNDTDIIIADGELSPVQVRNIEDETDVRVIDRTTLILDIFAKRAVSAEGKVQVELAQLKYSLPRLAGKGSSLSRLGGGIGTRGPGETKLETDKRHIRRRIQFLSESLAKMEKRRLAVHQRRSKNGASAVAIVGYTNAGKSTLMNRLTNAGVLEEDKLFATLDPTARRLTLPSGRQIMLIDTVGLVRRLPHQLVEAFKSTLEEALWADVILNVCDASSEECSRHIAVTNDLLTSLGCMDKPIINVLNKCDLVPDVLNYPLMPNCVHISAKSGYGIDKLLEAIDGAFPETKRRVTLLIPFSDIKIANELRNFGTVEAEEYTENGLKITAFAEISYIDKIKDYLSD